MKRLGLAALLAAAAFGQSVESVPYRVVLSPANEAPPANVTGNGWGTVWVHVVRNASGEVVSGSVDFKVGYTLTPPLTITGMHIHRGAAGGNGPIVIDPSFPRTDDTTGSGELRAQAQVAPGNATALQAVKDILNDPSGHYVNVHTSSFPAGVMRGQLERADVLTLMAMMSPANEAPPVTGLNVSGIGVFRAIVGRNSLHQITSAEVAFDINYTGFAADTRFTGFHVHSAGAGSIGPVVIDSGLTPTNASSTGDGNLHLERELPLTQAALAALYGLFTDPRNYYLNIHTSANPGGVMRNQLRRTDRATLQVSLSPANEVPPVTIDASALAALTLNTIRNSEGEVEGGVATFDVNFRFPGEAHFTGLHIHNGAAGAIGPVTIDSGLNSAANLRTVTGFGNIFRSNNIATAAGIAAMNSVVRNPELHYMNLHTAANPGGAIRSQLAPSSSATPVVTAILSANSDPMLTTVAPYGLLTVFGTNLMKVPGDNSGMTGAPESLNGTSITVGGKEAYLLQAVRVPAFIPTDYIVAQVPGDADPGDQAVVVKSSAGEGAPMMVKVAPIAPGLYFDQEAGLAVRYPDLTLIRANNPARAGGLIAVVSTGLGQTTPVLIGGQPAPANADTSNTTASVGGQAAEVLASTAIPGQIGYYWTILRVPANAGTGMAAVKINVGGVDSNAVMIPVQP
ncbi:MAG: CHRD domain-containing protein [Bryobacterales bacterium]|nr:CHRD domain-containing protein [Bryobacterales bacterium]